MPRVVTFNLRILKAPFLMLAAVVAFAIWQRDWPPLIAAPLIYLGWAGSAPNFNLADGCLAQLAMVIAAIVGFIIRSRLSLELGAVCWISWVLCCIELAVRCEMGRTGVDNPVNHAD